MAGTISVGKAQAKGPHLAFPSCPVAIHYLREVGEYCYGYRAPGYQLLLWSYEQNQG